MGLYILLPEYPIIVAAVCVLLSVLFNLSVAVLVGLGSTRHSSIPLYGENFFVTSSTMCMLPIFAESTTSFVR